MHPRFDRNVPQSIHVPSSALHALYSGHGKLLLFVF
jgi:hypothetical protein